MLRLLLLKNINLCPLLCMYDINVCYDTWIVSRKTYQPKVKLISQCFSMEWKAFFYFPNYLRFSPFHTMICLDWFKYRRAYFYRVDHILPLMQLRLADHEWIQLQWNLSVTTPSIIKFITCDLCSNVFQWRLKAPVYSCQQFLPSGRAT